MSEGTRRIRIAAALLTDARQRLLPVRKRGTAWLEPGTASTIPLAPLTRDHAVPLWRSMLTETSR